MARFEHVAVLGMGAFGVALSRLAAENAKSVSFWGRDARVCQHINSTHRHPHRLVHAGLPSNVTATTDLAQALHGACAVILTVPMPALRTVLAQVKSHIDKNAIVISTAKGIEESTLFLPSDVIKLSLAPELAQRACYLSGPSFAIELVMDLPTALTIASFDKVAATFAQNSLSTMACRFYRTDDVIGVVVGGALKNVIAIAAGACTGLSLGRNALASLITRGLVEMARLAHVLHGNASTLSGLAGAGDLILSCTDDMSRNHRLGTLLAGGHTLNDALVQIGSVVEGAKTARAIPLLENKHGIELPICHAVHQVLYESLAPKEAISSLLSRSLKEEML